MGVQILDADDSNKLAFMEVSMIEIILRFHSCS